MYPTRFSALASAIVFALTASADPNSVCNSFGIDFQDEGHYFINQASNESFTAVSQFEGCNTGDPADVALVDPSGDELYCSDVATTPNDVSMVSTCPIQKNQMVSGHWILLIFGNNGDGQPFAYQRDLYLDVGTQATATITPTVTWNVTTSPTVFINSTSTIFVTKTINATTTVIAPASTDYIIKTVTPKAVIETDTTTLTRTTKSYTKIQEIVTATITASCDIPSKPQWGDKSCVYIPTKISLPPWFPTPKPHLRGARRDRPADIEYVRRRIQNAKEKAAKKARDRQRIQERAPDAPTITITATDALNTTITYTASATTTTELEIETKNITTTLAPSTVYSGVFTNRTSITLAPVTKTRLTKTYVTSTITKTLETTWTLTETVKPTDFKSCFNNGGHFIGGGWRW